MTHFIETGQHNNAKDVVCACSDQDFKKKTENKRAYRSNLELYTTLSETTIDLVFCRFHLRIKCN